MKDNAGCTEYLGCYILELVIKATVCIGIILWQSYKYGSITNAYNH